MNLEQTDQAIIDYAKLQMKAFQMLLNSGNILKSRSDMSENAINILRLNPEFSSFERNKLKTFYETAKKMYTNEELFFYYQDISSRKVSDFTSMQKLRPKKQIISWFSRFTQNQKPLPVYKLDPNDIKPSVLYEDTPQNRNKVVNSIINADPTNISFFESSVLTFSNDDKNALEPFEVAITPNGCEIRDEIKNTVMNYETKNMSMDTSETKYTETSGKAEIPMYFVILVGAERAIHLMLYIMCNNNVYTIGLGYLGEENDKITRKLNKFGDHTIAISTLYSPDYLLEIEENRKNSIIDIGILTMTHINNLEKYLKTVKNIIVDYYYRPTEVLLNTTYLMGLPQRYSLVSNELLVSNYINCTSFIVDIFPHISCKIITRVLPVVSPGWCKTNPPLTDLDIEKIYEYYLSNTPESTQQLINYLENRKKMIEDCINNQQCVISGGKKGCRSRRKCRSKVRGRSRGRGRKTRKARGAKRTKHRQRS